MISRSSIALSLLIAAGVSPAALSQGTDSLVAGPSLGFVYDHSSRSLKPLLGNAAAAMIGPALDLGAEFSTAAISPKQNFALTVVGGSNVVLVRLDGGRPQSSVLSVLPPAPDRVVLSPGGGAAALYYAATRSIQVVGGLPNSPVFSSVAVTALPAGPDALAISDDGQALLAGVNGQDAGEVYLLGSDGSAQRVLQVGRVSAVTFFHQSQDALVADGAGHQLMRLSKGPDGVISTVIARQKDGIEDPVALAASVDNGLALVANGSAASVVLVNLSSGVAVGLGCQCAPTVLAGLSGQSIYRLNELSELPISVLDVSGTKPVVNIIPPEIKLYPDLVVRVPERGIRK